MKLDFTLLAGHFAISRLPSDAEVPDWARAGILASVCRTPDEVSVVCEEDRVPAGVRTEPGWRALKVSGPLDFELTGVLLSIAEPLAKADLAIFALSTFDTDYVLVRDESLERALAALRAASHTVLEQGDCP